MSEVWKAGGMVLLCTLSSVTPSVITVIFTTRIGSNLAATLRGCMFMKVQHFSLEEIGKFSTTSLITRSTSRC